MTGIDPQTLEKALRARDQLAELLLAHPDISLIDLGYDPEESGSARQLAVRVHTRRPVDREALGIPLEIDSIPVRILTGDYHFE